MFPNVTPLALKPHTTMKNLTNLMSPKQVLMVTHFADTLREGRDPSFLFTPVITNPILPDYLQEVKAFDIIMELDKELQANLTKIESLEDLFLVQEDNIKSIQSEMIRLAEEQTEIEKYTAQEYGIYGTAKLNEISSRFQTLTDELQLSLDAASVSSQEIQVAESGREKLQEDIVFRIDNYEKKFSKTFDSTSPPFEIMGPTMVPKTTTTGAQMTELELSSLEESCILAGSRLLDVTQTLNAANEIFDKVIDAEPMIVMDVENAKREREIARNDVNVATDEVAAIERKIKRARIVIPKPSISLNRYVPPSPVPLTPFNSTVGLSKAMESLNRNLHIVFPLKDIASSNRLYIDALFDISKFAEIANDVDAMNNLKMIYDEECYRLLNFDSAAIPKSCQVISTMGVGLGIGTSSVDALDANKVKKKKKRKFKYVVYLLSKKKD